VKPEVLQVLCNSGERMFQWIGSRREEVKWDCGSRKCKYKSEQ
jgi:hypothetical protein